MERRITGRYVLRRPLGQGESASVHLALDLVDEREVALKLASDADESTSRSLRREFELLGGLRHPNLPEVYDFGWDEDLGRCFFTMELIEGRSLAHALPELDEAQRTDVFLQACRGLAFQHRRGLVHGDLKPDNLLVRETAQGRPWLKIIDLGLSGREGEGRRGVIRGTPRYAAASVMAGEPPTAVSDLHALGATFLDALGAWAERAGAEPAGASPRLVAVLRRLVAPDPDARYQSAGDALRDLLPHAPPEAGLPDAGEEVRPTFVGRAVERERLTRLCDALANGDALANRTRLVTVTGAPGLGKSALVEEVRRAAELRRITVCRGACTAEVAGPLVAWRGVLRHLEFLTGAGPHGVPDDLAALVATLDATPSGASSPDAGGAADEPLVERFAAVLRERGRERPLLVLLEDLQWADEATVRTLVALAGRELGRVAFVAACRTADAAGERVADELRTATGAEELALENLDRAETLALVESLLDAAGEDVVALERLAELTEGHPLFAESAARAVARERRLRPETALEEAVHAGMPATLAEALARRLEELGEDERRLVRELAVLSREASPRLLATMSATSPEATAHALARLARRGLLRVEERRGRREYALRSDALRHLVTSRLTVDERRDLHRRAANAWRQLAHDPSAVADVLTVHALEAGEAASAVESGVEAVAQLVARWAPRAALALLGRLEALPETARSGHVAQLAELQGDARHEAGDFARARDSFDRALEARGREPHTERRRHAEARLHRKVAAEHQALGELERARDALRAALERAPDAAPAELARTYELLGQVEFALGDASTACASLERGLDVLPDADNDAAAASLWNNLGVIAFRRGDYERAAAFHEKALAIRERHDDEEGKSRSLANLGAVCQVAGRYEEAQERYERSLAIKAELGNRQGVALLLGNLALLDHWLGRYGPAIQRGEDALRIREETGDAAGQIASRRDLAEVWLEKGELRTARDGARGAVELARRSGGRGTLARCLLVEAEVELVSGRLVRARELADEALAIALETGHRPELAVALQLRGRLATWAPRPDEPSGERSFEESIELLAGTNEPRTLATCLLAAAEGALEESGGERARVRALEALAIAEDLRTPPLVAHAELWLGRAALSLGELEEASARLRVARRTAEALSTPELLWRVQASLAAYHAAAGRWRRAVGWMRECVGILRGVASGLGGPELENAYLGAPWRIREIETLQRWVAAGHASPAEPR